MITSPPPPRPPAGEAAPPAAAPPPPRRLSSPSPHARAARCEVFLVLAILCEAIVMRAARVQHAGNRKIEIDVVFRQAGERGGGNRHPVIGLHAADDLLLVRASERIIHVPDELHLAVVGFRA